MATYFRPTPDTGLKSSSLSAYASGVAVNSRYDLDTWVVSGSGLVQTSVSGTVGASGVGSLVACSDGASGEWVAQISGSAIQYASGGTTTAYSMSASAAITGAIYNSAQSAPYFLSANGALTTISAGASANVAGGFGVSGIGLATSGSVLFSLLPGTPALGTYALSSQTSGTSGSIASPITAPACLAATSGFVAVGGWNFATLGSGFTSMAISPATFASLIGATPSTGSVSAWGITTGNTWAFTSVASGLGAPKYVAWVPNGLYALASDPTNGTLYNFSYSLGTITQIQSLAIAGAGPVAMLPDNVHGLLCKTSANQAIALTYSGSTVSSGAAITIAAPSSIAYAGTSGHMLVGCASGLALTTINVSGVWSVAATGAVGFVPTSLYVDSAGNAYCAATSGASGLFAIATSGLALVGSGSFAGSAVGITYLQGQTLVADGINALVRGFGPKGTVYSQYASAAAPSGLSSIVLNALEGSEQDIFASGTSTTYQLSLTAPYYTDRVRQGAVSVYASGAWTNYVLSVNTLPEAIAWDPSGNLSVYTLPNTLYTFSSGLTLISSGIVAQQTGIAQSTPIGISALLWQGGHLYGSTGLNDSLVEIE
jgi:hypothetical protein